MTAISTADFQAEAKQFLDANAQQRVEEKFEWGKGSDHVGLLDEKTPEQEAAEIASAKGWKAAEFDAGFGWITGPEEYGGRALSSDYQRVYRELASDYAIPSQTMFGIGLGMVAPTILAHAIPEVRSRYLPPLYRGDMVACQLFSEPVAGSDLAGIQTRAVRDGDEWIVSGQKVWTSGAHYSDIGEIITRSSPDKPKHKGLTMLLVDMHAPGVDVRPLRQMTGGASFNEVFFEEVRVPDSHRLGDVDEGWTVALTTLMNERAAIGGGSGGVGGVNFHRFKEMAIHFGLDEDPIVRQRLADIYIRLAVARYTNLRAMEKVRAGQLPGPELSIGKLALTQNMQVIAETLAEMLGPRIIANGGEWGTYAWAEFILGVPGMRVAGGTDEVMRNIVGERVLGLPKEPRAAG
jgi:alkylation response protein AidB-like acyl-CoA dehydrogenase